MAGNMNSLINKSNDIYTKLMTYTLNVSSTGNSNLWEGTARNKFYTDYSKIVPQMESVATSVFYLEKAMISCDEFNNIYLEYKAEKDKYNQLYADYRAARSNNDFASVSLLASLVNSSNQKLLNMENQLRNKKTEIRSFLLNVK